MIDPAIAARDGRPVEGLQRLEGGTDQSSVTRGIRRQDRGETAGGGHSSVTPALRNPVKKVVSARALVLGTPNDMVVLNWAMLA